MMRSTYKNATSERRRRIEELLIDIHSDWDCPLGKCVQFALWTTDDREKWKFHIPYRIIMLMMKKENEPTHINNNDLIFISENDIEILFMH